MATRGVIPSGVKEFNWFLENGGLKDKACVAARTVLTGLVPDAEITCIKHCPFGECIGEELGNNKRKKWLDALQIGFKSGMVYRERILYEGVQSG